jgi:hypothetical protein
MQIKRKNFIRGDVATVPSGVAIGALNNRFQWAKAADFDSDVDVLNYALTLEYLEAEFYRQGNEAGLLSGKEAQYLQKVQTDEESHVATVMQTVQQIGGQPVEAPAVDFGDAFSSRDKYLTLSHTFENVGVQAYLGAAGFISDKAILQAAAGIFGVEARHAAIVGNLLGLEAEGGVYMGAVETPLTKDEVLAAVTPFLADPGAAGGGAAVTL